jgi:hypothetical protein
VNIAVCRSIIQKSILHAEYAEEWITLRKNILRASIAEAQSILPKDMNLAEYAVLILTSQISTRVIIVQPADMIQRIALISLILAQFATATIISRKITRITAQTAVIPITIPMIVHTTL